ncbi:hypothetical protein GCM10028895_12130 [Pontibacter rugosus]
MAAASLSSLVSDQRVILLGETNHGVSQHYATAASFTKKMLAEKGFELIQSESSFYKTFIALANGGEPSIQGLSEIYRYTEEFSPCWHMPGNTRFCMRALTRR